MENHIQVALRVRPLLEGEKERGEMAAVSVVAGEDSPLLGTSGTCIGGGESLVRVVLPSGGNVSCIHKGGGKPSNPVRPAASNAKCEIQHFCFDTCIGPDATQEDVMGLLNLRAYCDDALRGVAATVLCFGQTGSGKTYTMSGPSLNRFNDDRNDDTEKQEASRAPTKVEEQVDEGDTNIMVAEDGMAYFCAKYIAARQQALSQEGTARVTVKASYLELYNESLNDLLQGSSGLKCRWSAASKSFFVEDLMIVECTEVTDLLLVLREGQRNRKWAEHQLNQDSSRSHLIFTVYVESQNDDEPTRYGKLTLVDLAGSEKMRDTGNHGEDTKSINRSLFALGNVIELLSAQQQKRQKAGTVVPKPKGRRSSAQASGDSSGYIPYRSSVLTQLLMDSLQGNCRTLMVACVTPSSRFVAESLRTIHYAQRTRHICSAPAERVDLDQQERFNLRETVRLLQAETAMLRRFLHLPLQGPISEEMVAEQIASLKSSGDRQPGAAPRALPSLVGTRYAHTPPAGPPKQQSQSDSLAVATGKPQSAPLQTRSTRYGLQRPTVTHPLAAHRTSGSPALRERRMVPSLAVHLPSLGVDQTLSAPQHPELCARAPTQLMVASPTEDVQPVTNETNQPKNECRVFSALDFLEQLPDTSQLAQVSTQSYGFQRNGNKRSLFRGS